MRNTEEEKAGCRLSRPFRCRGPTWARSRERCSRKGSSSEHCHQPTWVSGRWGAGGAAKAAKRGAPGACPESAPRAPRLPEGRKSLCSLLSSTGVVGVGFCCHLPGAGLRPSEPSTGLATTHGGLAVAGCAGWSWLGLGGPWIQHPHYPSAGISRGRARKLLHPIVRGCP